MKVYKPIAEVRIRVEYAFVYESIDHFESKINCKQYHSDTKERDIPSKIKPLIAVDHKVGDLIECEGDTYRVEKISDYNTDFDDTLRLLSFHLVKI